MSFKNILEAYDMFKAIINHIEQNYNVTFPTTLTRQDTDWSDIKELFRRIEQYPFIQESQRDDAEEQNETETEMEIDYGDETDADDEDETASNLGDYFT
jgi:hypothetical protein